MHIYLIVYQIEFSTHEITAAKCLRKKKIPTTHRIAMTETTSPIKSQVDKGYPIKPCEELPPVRADFFCRAHQIQAENTMSYRFRAIKF
mmetsp:Transcript_6296/g.10456  ORF Transcript_6296/g.10456 Transcript_6296/m.10456 type:complete len:89 (+) Transcript_6296:361-627(+)